MYKFSFSDNENADLLIAQINLNFSSSYTFAKNFGTVYKFIIALKGYFQCGSNRSKLQRFGLAMDNHSENVHVCTVHVYMQ